MGISTVTNILMLGLMILIYRAVDVRTILILMAIIMPRVLLMMLIVATIQTLIIAMPVLPILL